MALGVDLGAGGHDVGANGVLLPLQIDEDGGVLGYLRLGVAQRILGDEEVLERLGLVSTKCRHLLLQLLTLGEEGADLVS